MELTGFRDLYDGMLQQGVHALPDYLLSPELLAAARDLMRPLQRYRRREHSYHASESDLWELYALSSANDYLLSAFRDGGSAPAFEGVRLRFFEALGFEAILGRPYSPFYHEIVDVMEPTGQPPRRFHRPCALARTLVR